MATGLQPVNQMFIHFVIGLALNSGLSSVLRLALGVSGFLSHNTDCITDIQKFYLGWQILQGKQNRSLNQVHSELKGICPIFKSAIYQLFIY